MAKDTSAGFHNTLASSPFTLKSIILSQSNKQQMEMLDYSPCNRQQIRVLGQYNSWRHKFWMEQIFFKKSEICREEWSETTIRNSKIFIWGTTITESSNVRSLTHLLKNREQTARGKYQRHSSVITLSFIKGLKDQSKHFKVEVLIYRVLYGQHIKTRTTVCSVNMLMERASIIDICLLFEVLRKTKIKELWKYEYC